MKRTRLVPVIIFLFVALAVVWFAFYRTAAVVVGPAMTGTPSSPGLVSSPSITAGLTDAVIDTPEPRSSPSPAETASVTSTTGFPIRAAFYYPWFPEAWSQQGYDPFTHYHPLLGFYDSSNMKVIQQHIQEMLYGGITLGIASWWGQGSPTDGRAPELLQAANGSGFRWALYYEYEGISNPSPAEISSDLVYIRDRYSSNPNYLKIDGRFVVFVYGDTSDDCGMADRWKQGNTVNAYIVLKVFPKYASCPNPPDGWHQYSPADAAIDRSFSYTISPGFWKQGEAAPRLGRNLSRWDSDIQAMIASGARFQLITTFNEWGEGTAVEPAQEWSSPSGYGVYLDALHDNGNPPLASQSTGMATPAP